MKFGEFVKVNEKLDKKVKDERKSGKERSGDTAQALRKRASRAGRTVASQREIERLRTPVTRTVRGDHWRVGKWTHQVFTECVRRHFDPKRLDASYETRSRPWEKKLRKLGFGCVEHFMWVCENMWMGMEDWSNFGVTWTVEPMIKDVAEVKKFGDKGHKELWGPANLVIYRNKTEKRRGVKCWLHYGEVSESPVHIPCQPRYNVPTCRKYDVSMGPNWDSPLCAERRD